MEAYDRISIWGVLKIEPDLFEYFVIPEGLDRENVIDSIVLESTELELYYSDPDFLKDAIGIWSHKKLGTWEKIYQVLKADYNPLENYDRFEKWNDSGTGRSSESNISQGGSESEEFGDSSGSSEGNTRNSVTSNANSVNNNESVNKVNGFNDGDSSLTTHDRNEGSSVSSSSDTSDNEGSSLSSTESENHSTRSATDSRTDNREGNTANQSEHEGRVHGNIGVTTSQQMLEAEIELRTKYNITDIIVNDFIKQFCLRVY